MPHGRSPPLLGLVVGGFGLGDALVEDLSVLVGSILGGLGAAALECDAVALVLEALGGNQTLDLGGLGVGLCALLLGLDLAADDELTDLHSCQHSFLRLSPPRISGELAMKL